MVSIKGSWNYTLLVYLILAVGSNISLMGHKSNSTTLNLRILNTPKWTSILNKRRRPANMTVATVSCGSRSDDALILLKSCLLVSPKSSIRFIVFTDDKDIFKRQFISWKKDVNKLLEYEIRKPTYPTNDGIDRSTFCSVCICQRLFLAELLPHIDSLIHVDADCILLSPVETLWKHFNEFNSTQIIGIGPDHENYRASHYAQAANHPIHGKSGVNAGVLLMNLTRMRAFGWSEHILRVHRRWDNMNWCGQGYFNILFNEYPERFYLLYCSANFQAQFCKHNLPDCTAAVRGGIQVLHGTARDFLSGSYPAFTAVYNITKDFQLGMNRTRYFFEPILKMFKSSMNVLCADAIVASIKINKWAN